MKKYFALLVLALLTAVLFTACGEVKPVEATDPSVVKTLCVSPETDNKYRWSASSCVDIDTTVYTVTVQVADEIINHTEINGAGSGFSYGGYGYASMRIWQDGKGILPVKVISLSPAFQSVSDGDYIILKTSDLKAMALDNGAAATFICNQDVEVLSPVQNMQVLTTDRLTYELDNCRMLTPEFSPPAAP